MMCFISFLYLNCLKLDEVFYEDLKNNIALLAKLIYIKKFQMRDSFQLVLQFFIG
jgi:hypothetical protein